MAPRPCLPPRFRRLPIRNVNNILTLEPLEDRTLLDVAAIAVGRTLSTYTSSGVLNDEVTITYTVYNIQANEVEGVLLATNLEPGVNFQSASALPDQSGQELAWSLGVLEPFGRVSVELTVSLTDSGTLQLDRGARAFGTLEARAVSDDAPAAVLRSDEVSGDFLGSTPDANINDPVIQAKAAELDYDPDQMFAFLRDEIGYESYSGSLRGARGALWSAAGNALDEASLGVALLRASGIPARYAHGTLSEELAQDLILSMFPPTFQTVGYVPDGVEVADPANDPKLLAKSVEHYWIQFDTGTGFVDGDTAFADSPIGIANASVETTFAEVPDEMRHKAVVRLQAEFSNQFAAIFPLAPTEPDTVLEQTFNVVELVGKPLTIGHFVSTNSVPSPLFSAETFIYTPYLLVGENDQDISDDEVLLGQEYQEVNTNFPFANQTLTGLFLSVELSSPDGSQEVHERTLVDRIGYAARQGGGTSEVSLLSDEPALTDLDVFTINIAPGSHDPGLLYGQLDQIDRLTQELSEIQVRLDEIDPNSALEVGQLGVDFTETVRNLLILTSWTRISDFSVLSNHMTEQLEGAYSVRGYFDKPRITMVTAQSDLSETSVGNSRFAIDLIRETTRAIAFPGQNAEAQLDFMLGRGLATNAVEGNVISLWASPANGEGSISTSVVTYQIFEAAEADGIELALITPEDIAQVNFFEISADAKARITAAAERGSLVLVPRESVLIEGVERVGWYDYNPSTGEVIGVLEDGSHGSFVEYAVGLSQLLGQINNGILHIIMGEIAGSHLGVVARVVPAVLNPHCVTGGVTFLPFEGRDCSGSIEKIKSDVAKLADKISVNLLKAALGSTGGPFQVNLSLFAIQFQSAFNRADSVFAALGIVDPPIVPFLSAAVPPPTLVPNIAVTSRQTTVQLGTPTIDTDLNADHLVVGGEMQAEWSTETVVFVLARTLQANAATVLDVSGNVVGAGPVSLVAMNSQPISVSGEVSYQVGGEGTLNFYPPATTELGISAQWTQHITTLTGDISLQLNVANLTVDGVLLPAGTYTILTNSASLTGTGQSSAPNFVGELTLNVTLGDVEIGPSAGTFVVNSSPVSITEGAALTGFQGEIVVTAGEPRDNVLLAGTSTDVVLLSATPNTATTDQNTPITIGVNLSSAVADTFSLTVEAPEGWTTAFDEQGRIVAKPAPGLQGGSYGISITASSESRPGVNATTEVIVTIVPTQPGLTLEVQPDPLFTVPFGGNELPTSYRAFLTNTGPTEQTISLDFPEIPDGFEVLNSGTTFTIPAGETGIVGLYLRPIGSVPAAGTSAPFGVTATNTSDSILTSTVTLPFVVPEVQGVNFIGNPPSLNALPGTEVTATLEIANIGNVSVSPTLTVSLSPGLSASALSPVSLGVGESTTIPVTLTPDASLPLNTTPFATFTASFGTDALPLTQVVQIPVQLVVPGALAIADASNAALQLGNADLSARLDDLARAMTSLVQDPANEVAKSQTLASLEAIVGLLATEPILANAANELTAVQTSLANAGTSDEILSATDSLGSALEVLRTVISDLADHNFTFTLAPNNVVALPRTPARFDLLLQNLGTEPTTYRFSVTGLPPQVNATFSQPTVTLNPGEFLTGADEVRLTLTPALNELIPIGFTVTTTVEGIPDITRNEEGALTTRNEFARVVQVVTDPPFTDPGAIVQVSARVLNVVNQEQSAIASFTVMDGDGQLILESIPALITLGTSVSVDTFRLGTIDTTVYALGDYSIDVTLTDLDGEPIPGAVGQGDLLIGSPLAATFFTSETALPPGTTRVTSTLQIDAEVEFPEPLDLRSQIDTNAIGYSVATSGDLAYVIGSEDITILNIADPDNPKIVDTFGSDALVAGGRNVGVIAGERLIVGSQLAIDAEAFRLLIFSLENPLAPAFVSETLIGFRFLNELFVQGDTVYATTSGITFFQSGGIIFDQYGDFLAIDISNPENPALTDVLLAPDAAPNGSSNNVNGVATVNSQLAYLASTTSQGSNTSGGIGRLQVVNVADPTDLTLIRSLDIPGTVQLMDVAVRGDRALVVGSSGGWRNLFGDISNAGFEGNLTLTVLDITDPENPQILGSTVRTDYAFPRGVTTGLSGGIIDLDNGLFGVRSIVLEDQPVLLLIDINNPEGLVVGSFDATSPVNGLAVENGLLYGASTDGLATYDLGPVVGIPFTVSARIPSSGANILFNSHNIPPDRVEFNGPFRTLFWERTFGAGGNSLTLTWEQQLNGLRVGEVRPVTFGTTIDFVSEVQAGTLELPTAYVYVEQIIGLEPVDQTVRPGEEASYTLSLSNPTDHEVTYDLSSVGVPSTWVNLADSVIVAAESVATVPLTITSDAFSTLGDYSFTVTASAGGALGYVQGLINLLGDPITTPDPAAHGVVTSLTPTSAVAGQGTSGRYVVRLINTGSVLETFSLALDLPPNVVAELDQTTIDVPPGESNFRDVVLFLTPTPGTTLGDQPFTVTAISAQDSSIRSTADGILSVVELGVDISLAPSTSDPSTTFELVVTNTGTVTETFDLAVGGPAALVAQLQTNEVSLEPGTSTTVLITLENIDVALPGTLDLIATGTARTNTAVQDVSLASVAITSRKGLQVNFEPASQILPEPGMASFLLFVQNTGNVEDAYTAIVTGVDGPVQARFVGLEGELTQSIPLFRIPGLSTAALVIETELDNFGTGQAQVEVKSLNDQTIVATATAVVETDLAETTTQVTATPNPAEFGELITLRAEVNSTISDGGFPTGTVEFFINGGQSGDPVTLVNGVGTTEVIGLTSGDYTVTARYISDVAHFAASEDTVRGGLSITPAQPPVGTLVHPAPNSLTGVDLGQVDVQWSDVGLSGLDESTFGIADVVISGVAVTGLEHLGSGLVRYFYTGDLTNGLVQVTQVAGQVADQAGNVNPKVIETFTYDNSAPSGDLVNPLAGVRTSADLGYVEIQWTDVGDAGLDPTTFDVTDVLITGVDVDAYEVLEPGRVRYIYNADDDVLPNGTVEVVQVAGAVQDLAGNALTGKTETFTLDIQGPALALVSPEENSQITDDPGYVELRWIDLGLAGIDTSTLGVEDITLTGVQISNVENLGEGLVRYHYTGALPTGTIEVIAPDDAIRDLAGNPSAAASFSFQRQANDPLRIEEIIINDGSAQRSNIETITIRFDQDTNIQALIASGQIVQAVQVVGSEPIALDALAYSYDATTFILIIDLTDDGFGGSQSTRLEDGRYQLLLDTTIIHRSNDSSQKLLDEDSDPEDSLFTFDFHRLLTDWNGDGIVDLADRDLFFQHYPAASANDPSYAFAFDVDEDGDIDATDYFIWKGRLGLQVERQD